MAHLIDKDALVAEVQRLQDLTMDENKNFYSEAAEGEYNALCNIEHFIDSLQEEPDDIGRIAEHIDWIEYQLNLRLPDTLDYNGIKVDRADFIEDFKQALREE